MEYDIVIIGSGVAGLTAGLYAGRAKKSVLIIEDFLLGGTTATLTDIENYPGFAKINGFDLINNIYMQVVDAGVVVEYFNIKSIDFDNNTITLDNNTLKYKTLIIASGTSYKRLNVENEDKFKHNGISYCAVCDGTLYKNKNIAVVTDGMSGKNSIDYLYNLTQNITVLDINDKYSNTKLKTYNNVKLNKLIGEDNLESIEFESNGNKFMLNIDGMFVAMGKKTDLHLYENNLEIENGFLVSDENMHTCIPNVFVAGDIRKKSLRQIVTACADGAIAATEAIKYLSK